MEPSIDPHSDLSRTNKKKLWIIAPVYFDVQCYKELVKRIRAIPFSTHKIDREINLIAIDDSAGQDAEFEELRNDKSIRIITPSRNLGHQKAFIFALQAIAKEVADDDIVVTLDVDCQDEPNDIPKLINALLSEQEETIVLAKRIKRKEGKAFKFFYFLFKIIFRIFTGHMIDTGNFAVYKGKTAKEIANDDRSSLCYSSSLLILKKRTVKVPSERGYRFSGKSKMNGRSLIKHGLRMFLPMQEEVLQRSFVILGIVSLLLSCIIASSKKYFWMDEFFTYYPSSYHSFFDMLSFITDKINAGSPFYFIVVWFWARIFNTSELSIRMFSSIGIGISFFVTWKLLRRFYEPWIALLSSLAIFMTSTEILLQNSEGRFYGMLMCILSVLAYWTVISIKEINFSRRSFFIQFFLHGLLPLIHPFGFLYSFIFTFSAVVIDIKRKTLRLWYYSSAFAGWLLFIPYIPAFLRQQELLKPRFWITIPHFINLLAVYIGSGLLLYTAVGILFVGLVIRFFSMNERNKRRSFSKPKDGSLLLIALLLLLMPIALWFESQWFIPLFYGRYVIGVNIGICIVLASLLSRILPKEIDLSVDKKMIFTSIAIVLIWHPFAEALKKPAEPLPGISEVSLYPDLPIAMDLPDPYLQRSFYLPNGNRYFYILDQTTSFDPRNNPASSQDLQVMGQLKIHVPDQNIIESNEFLSKFPRFLAATNARWFEWTLLPDLHYKKTYLGNEYDRYGNLFDMYLVEKN